MWIKAMGQEDTAWRFARQGSRLVVTEETKATQMSGMGMQGQTKQVIKLSF